MVMLELTFRKMEQLENFMSLKRPPTSEVVQELEDALFPQGVNKQVDDGDVVELQKALSIQLPDDYIHFLKQYGFAMWTGIIIYGISPVIGADVGSFNFSTVENTQSVWQEDFLNFRHVLSGGIVIGRDGSGGYYVLSVGHKVFHDGVHHFIHENEWRAFQSWPTFGAFLEYQISITD